MPYTISHSIIAAPIWYCLSKKIPLAPIIIGCIAPDLPYLFYLHPVHTSSHDLLGIFNHALPFGIIILLIWNLFLEKPIHRLFALKQNEKEFSLKYVSFTLTGIILGSASHVLIDSTSHSSGWFVENFNIFNYKIANFHLYQIIQYSGSILGLFALVYWYLKTLSNSNVARPDSNYIKTGMIAFSISIVSFAILANVIHKSNSITTFTINTGTGILSGIFVGACLFSYLSRKIKN